MLIMHMMTPMGTLLLLRFVDLRGCRVARFLGLRPLRLLLGEHLGYLGLVNC